MMAIADACADGRIGAQVGVVVVPKSGLALEGRAVSAGLPVVKVEYEPKLTYGQRLAAALAECDLVCLAGYLRLLPIEVLRAFPDRVLNIHPALLPAFGGRGMYGMRVHEAVVAAGVPESGCTVHVVNECYDEGRILVQRRVPVIPDDSPETLAARVLVQEHLAYVEAINILLGHSFE
jgi:formyltetrahydrofolate-dependent phosphoribosylglycinamide formyltransferase